MDKINPEELRYFYDEPIYVLQEHGDHPIEETEKLEPVAYSGKNLKGIAVYYSSDKTGSTEDIEFLFKGLNALEIFNDDIALVNGVYSAKHEHPSHAKRLIFSDDSDEAKRYKVIDSKGARQLTCASLSSIRNSQELKKTFWLALKDLFDKK